MNQQQAPFADMKMGTKEGQTQGQNDVPGTISRAAKTHQDYWKPRLRRRSFKGRNGNSTIIPEWQIRMKHESREAWFNLNTVNRAAAALKARDIYLSLLAVGWVGTMARYKPVTTAATRMASVGEFLADVLSNSHLKAMTVRRYAVKLRKMVADLARVDEGLKGKARRAKYDYVNGGRKAWLAKVDVQPLNLLTPDAVNAWRNAYVAKAGSNPLERKSAERSAASYLRCARALFAPDVVSVLKVNMPPNPFAGVKLKDPGAQRYHSEINAALLMACAERELRQQRPQLFLALVLCFYGALRRKEADLLTWEQVDFAAEQIQVRRTAHFEPKTEESQRRIDLGAEALEVLRAAKKRSVTEFVLEGSDSHPAATYDYYRCDCTWRNLIAWLRSKGVRQLKAIHVLRKESGSLIASSHGIEAARQHLGHRDIRTTSNHYVDKKARAEITTPMDGRLAVV